jgi:hypothetical protein
MLVMSRESEALPHVRNLVNKQVHSPISEGTRNVAPTGSDLLLPAERLCVHSGEKLLRESEAAGNR